MHIIEEKWTDILAFLKTEFHVQNVSFATWLQPLKVREVLGNTVYIQVQSIEWVDYLERKYKTPLQVSVEELTGETVDIVFVAGSDSTPAVTEKNRAAEDTGLNERYRFDSFVVGTENKSAYLAACAVAEEPGRPEYNPLYIYGGVGIGKTHLLNSIAHYILQHAPQVNVLYTTSEDFTNELINILMKGKSGKVAEQADLMKKFREKYRSVDVLLIDDIQFIIGKEGTQEEFFHTFNHLHMAGKQIVLSSDRPPKELKTLAERIKSRFAWGLLVDIGFPEYETRLEILRRKIGQEGWESYAFPEDVLRYIAENVTANVRELEGALNKIVAWYKLNQYDGPIDIILAGEILKDVISPDEAKSITPELILDRVMEYYSVSLADLKSKKRDARIVIPRQVAMYLLHDMTELTLEGIGIILGGKHYATVKHGVEKIEEMVEEDKELERAVNTLRKIIGG